jgi:CHASE2 domain-containing sensor protein
VKKYLLLPIFVWLSGCDQHAATDKIVVVDIHNYDRLRIARQIQHIHALHPKVIALDILFPARHDADVDSVLQATLRSCDNLVMPSLIRNYTHEDIEYQDTVGCDPYFLSHAKTGFINCFLEDDKFGTLKRFSIREHVNGKVEYNFAVRTAMAFDSTRAMSFINHNPKIIDVNYQQDQQRIRVISAVDALNGNLDRKDIEGKIVLLGSFWMLEDNPDIFVSPLNTRPERYEPDMWGVMYLANIVLQVLE